METIRLELESTANRSYDVLVGRGVLHELHREIRRLGRFSRCAVVVDEQVCATVGEPLQARLNEHGIRTTLLTIPAGETAKTAETVLDLCEQLVALGFDRHSLLLAVGGGVVGDITGFAAAIYLRGIGYIQVPTTLLAQVDSAIGGKTGVDLRSGKNLLGAFYQPLLVVTDADVLTTLPREAMREGFAEVIKTALIADPALFAIVEKEGPSLLDPQNSQLEGVIAQTCRIKCQVVSQDEKEAGLRRILNFGHTIGHALEAASNYTITHGRAVAMGMGVAIRASRRLAELSRADESRALGVIEKLGLPTELPADVELEDILASLEKDKKIQDEVCHFVLLTEIGRPIVRPIPLDHLRRDLGRMLSQSA